MPYVPAPTTVTLSRVGVPARRKRPCDDGVSTVRLFVCRTEPGACAITPNAAFWIVAFVNEAAVAVALTITPYQVPELVLDERNVTGAAVVPWTSSVPSMTS